jgi:Zn finger protein HypA/HybF involved in hydrogenase expression
MNTEMDDYTAQLRCPRCASSFAVELRKMRLNLPNLCPVCGTQCRISGDRAIKAQRLLERLEYHNRTFQLQL